MELPEEAAMARLPRALREGAADLVAAAGADAVDLPRVTELDVEAPSRLSSAGLGGVQVEEDGGSRRT